MEAHSLGTFWKCQIFLFLGVALLAHQVCDTLHQEESTRPASFRLLVDRLMDSAVSIFFNGNL